MATRVNFVQLEEGRAPVLETTEGIFEWTDLFGLKASPEDFRFNQSLDDLVEAVREKMYRGFEAPMFIRWVNFIVGTWRGRARLTVKPTEVEVTIVGALHPNMNHESESLAVFGKVATAQLPTKSAFGLDTWSAPEHWLSIAKRWGYRNPRPGETSLAILLTKDRGIWPVLVYARTDGVLNARPLIALFEDRKLERSAESPSEVDVEGDFGRLFMARLAGTGRGNGTNYVLIQSGALVRELGEPDPKDVNTVLLASTEYGYWKIVRFLRKVDAARREKQTLGNAQREVEEIFAQPEEVTEDDAPVGDVA